MNSSDDIISYPGVSIATSAKQACEEAEVLSIATNKNYGVVGLGSLDGEVEQSLIMERGRALTTAAVVLETFRTMDTDFRLGVH